MKHFIALMLAVFLCLSPMVSAITLSDTTEIQNSCKSFVDEGQVKKIDVSVLPPDGVIYNITVDSKNSILTARLAGIIAFSNLTYYHPEVTWGWIGIFLSSENPEFFDIYNSDLSPITDKANPGQSTALKVMNNIINTRGTSKTIKEHNEALTSKISTPKTLVSANKKSSTSKSYSSSQSSSDCDKVYVKGYYRKDGTYVRPHYRSKPGC